MDSEQDSIKDTLDIKVTSSSVNSGTGWHLITAIIAFIKYRQMMNLMISSVIQNSKDTANSR